VNYGASDPRADGAAIPEQPKFPETQPNRIAKSAPWHREPHPCPPAVGGRMGRRLRIRLDGFPALVGEWPATDRTGWRRQNVRVADVHV